MGYELSQLNLKAHILSLPVSCPGSHPDTAPFPSQLPIVLFLGLCWVLGSPVVTGSLHTWYDSVHSLLSPPPSRSTRKWDRKYSHVVFGGFFGGQLYAV